MLFYPEIFDSFRLLIFLVIYERATMIGLIGIQTIQIQRNVDLVVHNKYIYNRKLLSFINTPGTCPDYFIAQINFLSTKS